MSRDLLTRQIPNSNELNRFNVTKAGERDVVRQPLYDRQVYLAAGQTQMSFFQTGIAGRTYNETNMTGSGALTSPNEFLVETIEFDIVPGILNVPLVQQDPAVPFVASSYIDDVAAFYNHGSVLFKTLEKARVQVAPIKRCPPANALVTESSQAMAAATLAAGPQTAYFSQAQNARAGGMIYKVNPEVRLMPNEAFVVTLNWDAPIALPSGQNAFIFCYLGGLLYRAVQ